MAVKIWGHPKCGRWAKQEGSLCPVCKQVIEEVSWDEFIESVATALLIPEAWVDHEHERRGSGSKGTGSGAEG
jgi:uncharacterized protein with PIN domain